MVGRVPFLGSLYQGDSILFGVDKGCPLSWEPPSQREIHTVVCRLQHPCWCGHGRGERGEMHLARARVLCFFLGGRGGEETCHLWGARFRV